MQNRMKKEIRVSTAEILTFEYWENDVKLIPTGANIIILDKTGTEILASTACSIDAAGTVTYTILSTLITEVDINFRAEVIATIAAAEKITYLLFDVVKTPIESIISDEDLYGFVDSLRDSAETISSKSTATGTTSTLIDKSKLTQVDDYWNGGRLEINQSDVIKYAKVTDFVSTTSTITFSPVLASLVATDTTYRLRSSYQQKIDEAFQILKLEVRNRKELISGFIDSYAFRLPHIYKTIALACMGKKDDVDDKWSIWQAEFNLMYDNWIKQFNAGYDTDGDGSIADDETGQSVNSVNIKR